ncbi:5-methylcytosine restriction system specificity protein McrC [Formosa algae]|uniref:5-methylcytosine-specific restriction endonuclease McrBC regulatory subunit McrC n=1 Tax=Formosa algae TaxID=225843 RepID=A0A9X0YM86_9FLAO|nr:hypothetical protein [Formosa algae]MBP1840523.1 5-methylcytosine-specific restriction endonuclease McrBC regulatory subunit McrC [Formosa algae]MDQ0336064.1 5-methylcytosine-specific restriction endonuclease McrBC regulatory subunit McrC [Formosa algae]OEI81052.1 hypothetical protein AST99_05155 [Formosa algae]
MKITKPVNHNFYEEAPLSLKKLCDGFGVKLTQRKKIEHTLFSSVLELKRGDPRFENISVFGFKNIANEKADEDGLILKLYNKTNASNEIDYFIQTGLFAGIVYHKGYQFNINTRYGDAFLRRMLNFVNDIFVDDVDVNATKNNKKNNFLFILAYLFIQSLEKAAVLGLPQEYQTFTQTSNKVRGKIDLNSYLKNHMPFKGEITTTFREQTYIKEIIDVLYLALLKLEKSFGKEIHKRLMGVQTLLKQNYSGTYATQETIRKAKQHRVLNNPSFFSFKKVLEYAEIILLDQSMDPSTNIKNKTAGYLFDISQLFEIYLEKLLAHNFNDWEVTSQTELQLYQGLFYGRKMFPDLVMKHKYSNKIIVFDAKFKNMRLEGRDLDRSDFYQIHTYIQYYEPNVLFGGLIYPCSEPLMTQNAHSPNLFGHNSSTHFIVDGIYVNESMSMEDILENELDFVSRIEVLINETMPMESDVINSQNLV